MTRRAAVPLGVVAAFGLLQSSCPGWRPRTRLGAPDMTERRSGVSADLRAVRAVGEQTVWASGTGGTWLRTDDGGGTWLSGNVPGAEQIDFRSLAAFDGRRAIVLSAGSPARMFRTMDGGASWREAYRNEAPATFFDALRFADESSGYALGDPTGGRFVFLETTDGGETWTERSGPKALPGEAVFAASNSALAIRGSILWFATGGWAARVFRSDDRGRTWTETAVPAPRGAASRGVFSIAFLDERRGAIVGGDYERPDEPGVFATTEDGGFSWTPGPPPPGYRSCVVFLGPRRLIVTGPSGTESAEWGGDWRSVGPGMNALSNRGRVTWAVGPKGRIARLYARQIGGP